MKLVDLDQVSPSDLRHLAAAREARDSRRIADPGGLAEELGEMAAQGRAPTIGFWKRHLEPPPPPAPRARPSASQVTAWARTMCLEGWPEILVASGVPIAATDAGMPEDEATEATALGIAQARRVRKGKSRA